MSTIKVANLLKQWLKCQNVVTSNEDKGKGIMILELKIDVVHPVRPVLEGGGKIIQAHECYKIVKIERPVRP